MLQAALISGALFALTAPFIFGYLLNRHNHRPIEIGEVHDFFTGELRKLAIEDTQSIDMSDLLLEGDVTESFPNLGDQYFLADPLGSNSLPAYSESWLPIADSVFADLAKTEQLTGIGADIDAEWRDWNLRIVSVPV